MEMFKALRLYVYAIRVNNLVCYIGKGSETKKQDRIKHYFNKLELVTPYVREKLLEARSRGDKIDYFLLEEVVIPKGTTRAQGIPMEAAIFKAEARWIKEYGGSEKLWNRTRGGRSGWVASEETRKKMSDAQKARTDERRPFSVETRLAMRQAKLNGIHTEDHNRKIGLSVKAKIDQIKKSQIKTLARFRAEGVSIGRPKGWIVTQVEADALGLQVGSVELTGNQKKLLRNFRYSQRKLFTKTSK